MSSKACLLPLTPRLPTDWTRYPWRHTVAAKSREYRRICYAVAINIGSIASTYCRMGLFVDVKVEAGVAEDAEALLPRLRPAVQLEQESAAVRQQRRELEGGVGLALPRNLQPKVVLTVYC